MGYNLDAKCFVTSTEVLAEAYARQVLNGKSEILGTGDAVDACKIVARELSPSRARKRVLLCTLHGELFPLQLF